MSSLIIEDIPVAIKNIKQKLRKELPHYKQVFHALEENIRQQVETIHNEMALGQHPIPQIDFQDILHQRVDKQKIAKIKQRGTCVIHGIFARAQAEAWNQEIEQYLTRNNFTDCLKHAAKDSYFSQLSANKPQIYGIYWSKPQVEARQDSNMHKAQLFLNSLWQTQSAEKQHFDATRIATYADRIRRRPPQSATLGLSAHIDSGTIERWLDDNFRYVYRHVFSGNWQQYDPFAAAGRTAVREFASPAVCSMFRTFQGWTALTPQHANGGTLNLVPIANAIAYILLRALQDDVADDDLCGAAPGRALSITEQWHSLLLRALIPIPDMEPGDAVFWHCDLIHAVENEHNGIQDSNVMYICVAPGCEKNDAYLQRQLPAFLNGHTPPDFAPDNFETNFSGRATSAILTPLGKQQLGFPLKD